MITLIIKNPEKKEMYFLVHFLYYFKSAGTRGGDGRGLFCVMAAWGGGRKVME